MIFSTYIEKFGVRDFFKHKFLDFLAFIKTNINIVKEEKIFYIPMFFWISGCNRIRIIVAIVSGDLPGGRGSQGEHWGPRWSLLRGGVQEEGDNN